MGSYWEGIEAVGLETSFDILLRRTESVAIICFGVMLITTIRRDQLLQNKIFRLDGSQNL